MPAVSTIVTSHFYIKAVFTFCKLWQLIKRRCKGRYATLETSMKDGAQHKAVLSMLHTIELKRAAMNLENWDTMCVSCKCLT